jgi:hypothetical protein
MSKESGNITGQAFDPGVRTQIETRQRKLGKLNRSIDEIVGYNSSTAFLRLASSINLDNKALNEKKDGIEKLPFLTGVTDIKQYLGSGLAKKCVLFGGVVSIEETSYLSAGNQRENTFAPVMPAGIASPDMATGKVPTFNNGAYGWGGLESGYRPMPAIEAADISFYNRGALAKATIKLKANSIEQLQILDVLYFRVGYTMLLEWGHTAYFNNGDTLSFFKDFTTEPFRAFFNDGVSMVVDQNKMINSIKAERINHDYNYDAMIGKVTNFSWTYNNSGYDIEIKLVGLGDIVESLKVNKGSGGGKNLPDAEKVATSKVDAAETAKTAASEALDKLVGQADDFLFEGDYISTLTGTELVDFDFEDKTKRTAYLDQLNNALNKLNNDPTYQGLINQKSFNYTVASQQPTFNLLQDPSEGSENNPLSLFDDFKLTKGNAPEFLKDLGSLEGPSTASPAKKYRDALSVYITKLKSAISKASSTVSREIAAIKGLEQTRVYSANAILQNYNRCSLTRWLYDSIYRVPKISDVERTLEPYSADIAKPFIRFPFKQNSGGAGTFLFDQNYIKMGVLFNYIKHELLVYDLTKKNSTNSISSVSTGEEVGVPFINMDIDTTNTFCLSFPNQLSADPNICVIPFRYYDNPEDLKDIQDAARNGKFPTLNLLANTLTRDECFSPKGYLVNGNPYLGNPLNIYLNINFITQCLVDNSDKDGRTSLIAFLQAVLNGVNEALGGVNRMGINYDADNNSLRIIEENPLQYRKVKGGEKISTFNVYGLTQNPNPIYNTQGTSNSFVDSDLLWGSFINNVNFTVNIPPNMAAMATISAQSSGNIVGENATAISKLNKGLTDRIITQKLDPDMSSAAASGSKNDPNTIFGNNFKTQKSLVDNIYSGKYLLDNDLTSGLTDINKDISAFIVGYEALSEKMPAPFFLPFNLSLDMNGLSGMRNYERFAITENLLPPTYSVKEIVSANQSILKQGIIDFLIKGISHNITTNKWTTKIESITVKSERSEELQALLPGTNTVATAQATVLEVNIDSIPPPPPPTSKSKGTPKKGTK